MGYIASRYSLPFCGHSSERNAVNTPTSPRRLRNPALLSVSLVISAALFASPSARADLITYQSLLTSSQEVSAPPSNATGIGIVVFDTVANTIKVDLSWINLTSAAAAAHIHGPAPLGVNGPVLFPLTGVPSATAGAIPEQFFSVNSTQIGWLQTGLLYFNVHTSTNPGGEIRGQIVPAAIPEPSPLVVSSVFGMMVWGGRLLRRIRRLR